MLEVESSVISEIGYVYETQELIIQFHSGKYYKYTNVSEELYNLFVKAESKGKFFNARIKNKYPFVKIYL